MKIQKIQNYTPSFNAKLNITGEMFYGEVFDKMFEKASKIGTEKDVIDIKYVGYFAAKPKKAGKKEKHTAKFVAKFIQKGGNKSGDEIVKQDLADSSRYAYREKAKKAAVDYVDALFEKFAKQCVNKNIKKEAVNLKIKIDRL